MRGLWRTLGIAATAALVMLPERVHACPVCFGASDSPMARGVNMGIFALLVFTVLVLGSFAAFFIYLMRRAKLAELGSAALASGPAGIAGSTPLSRVANSSFEEPV